MRTDIQPRRTGAGDPAHDPSRAAALRRLAGVTVPSPAVEATHAPSDDRTSPVGSVPWVDPDGLRPVRVPPEEIDVGVWADPPWWRRMRWAPDRLAGVALVVLVMALGVFSVHRLLAAVPDAAPVPELPLASPGETVPDGTAVPPTPGRATAAPTAPVAEAEPVVVSVVGFVRRSGLVTVAPGARVADALEGAGGVSEGGDRDGLNLARRVADGEQILVGLAPGPDGPRGPRSGIVGAGPPSDVGPAGVVPGPGPAQGPAPGGPGLVDLNTADAAALDTLPGVGPVTAASILAWRDAHGRFSSIDQLAEIDGIGPATLSRLRPLVTV